MAATPERVQFSLREYRYTGVVDLTVRDRRKLARDSTVHSFFLDEWDAQVEATRQMLLLKADRSQFTVTLVGRLFDPALEPGKTITLQHPRFGLSGGRPFIITGRTEDVNANITTLRLWG